jgi:hypothetical protein
MPQPWRTVRTFISSTFRDMQTERDHLVRFVFPELRERCETIHLHLIDVDLRIICMRARISKSLRYFN